jgi:hypothetical protein
MGRIPYGGVSLGRLRVSGSKFSRVAPETILDTQLTPQILN